jgi:hypothetical protein
MRAVTVSERPDLVEPAWELTRDLLPEYNSHGEVLSRYWGRLIGERPSFQFHVIDDDGAVLARARTIPLGWDGTLDGLPAGIDGAIARGFDGGEANTLCALIVMIPTAEQRRGISAFALGAMAEIARAHGLTALIAPVRPSWKERYPLVPIAEYVTWRRSDGLAFDPWLRTHERLGARCLKTEPRSLAITGSVAEWEGWTEMRFPASGEYWFPGGLATLAVDREADIGRYWEPNVWMHHSI